MEATVKQRLMEYISVKGISIREFERVCGLSNGYIKSLRKSPTTDKMQSIVRAFPELNQEWLISGKGEMNVSPDAKTKNDGIPYYKDMPVSAGCAELQYTDSTEGAVGSINIAGVTGKYAFPVIGCSMEPIIHAGDVVVVDELNQWDRIDPDKIYLIITHDDRMIKHLELDEADRTKVWCVSPNYKRFSIAKTDIVRLYRVTFYGRLA